MKKLYLLLIGFSLCLTTAYANNTLSLQNLSVIQGTTVAVLPISLTNESNITGFQCDLYLPSGVTVGTDEYGDYMIGVARTTASRHTISTSLQVDGALRILCTSMTNATFSGNSGIVLNVTLAVPESMEAGTHGMSLKNIVLSDPEANRHTSPDMTATLIVEDSGIKESVNVLSLQDLSIDQGTRELVLPISLTNESSITGFQCDLYLPSGVTVGTDEYGDYMIGVARTTASRHTISTSLQVDGALRILCTSMTNATFSGNSGTVLNVTLAVQESITAGTHDMNLKNIVLSDPEANRHTSPDMTSSLIVAEVEKITIMANNITMVYGDAVPKLTYISEGSGLVGAPVLQCSATSTSPVGTYPITIAKGSVENKNLSLVNGTLTIVKAPLTISAGSYTKKQGEKNPEFSATYSGFKNGETSAVLIKQPTFTTDVTTSTSSGQYLVKVSGAEAQNYEISYVDGLIIVTNSFCSIEVQAGEYGRCLVNNQVVEPNVTYSSDDVLAYDSILTIYFVPFEGYTTICMKRNGILVAVRDNMYEEKITEDVVFSDIRFEALVDTFYISDYEDLIAPIITLNDAMVDIAPNITGITIYYTTDGSIPTSASKKYTGPFDAIDGMVVSAIAVIESKMTQKTISVSGIEGTSSRVKAYRFFNESGMELMIPSQGINIVLTEYDDGSRTVTKMYVK